MGLTIEVVECRIVMGVFGDDDVEPHVYLGRCEGMQNVPGLVDELIAASRLELGKRPWHDYFWSGSSAVFVEQA